MFEGFTHPTPDNTFLVPTVWFDICTQLHSRAELKTLLFVLHQTYGRSQQQHCTVNEIIHETGLSRRSALCGLQKAEQHGLLLKSKRGRNILYSSNKVEEVEGKTII